MILFLYDNWNWIAPLILSGAIIMNDIKNTIKINKLEDKLKDYEKTEEK